MTDAQMVPPAGTPITPPPGWHPDPTITGQLRYWDGAQWSEHTSPIPEAPAAPVEQTDPREFVIAVTTDSVPGREITDVLGVVSGSWMGDQGGLLGQLAFKRSASPGGVKLGIIPGGGMEAALQAQLIMLGSAMEIGADAVVGIRLQSTNRPGPGPFGLEGMAYGTAVRLSSQD